MGRVMAHRPMDIRPSCVHDGRRATQPYRARILKLAIMSIRNF